MSYSAKDIEVLDKRFPSLKDEFHIPTFKSLGITPPESKSENDDSIYLCGNSLGLMPKATESAIFEELAVWKGKGVEGHFQHPKTPWLDIDLPVVPLIAPIVGAKENEVAVMGTLTMNLNSLLCSFYQPKGRKRKILFEKHAFPSDFYAFLNQAYLKDLSEDDLLQLEPRTGEYTLRTEDIIKVIEDQHEEIALMCFPGIQYYTGQYFKMKEITKAAHEKEIIVGWDLAHAVGNVDVRLHDWDVDFACWCSYKYLNSGPGGIAGVFINERWTDQKFHSKSSPLNYFPRLAGWWGNNASARFSMKEVFDPIPSALGFRQSNPSVVDVVALHSSLKIIHKFGGIKAIREKSIEMTKLMEVLLKRSPHYVKPTELLSRGFTIITPHTSLERGSQISLLFADGWMPIVFEQLHSLGVICDERKPDVIRLAPVALYNSFQDVISAMEKLKASLDVASNAVMTVIT
ncbi:Kynureninase [Komagataella phaffii CBS 7435]|uniref:Kynureninase n=2 Tax=Komagataella phaffii TaxID=460519 RepID=C4R4Q1_KOMPG|nr:uncharacterized protein PAS_chr3_1194 [Komagataella phaffii GS115]AOA63176.1 GQ67_03561T0 [Komagataella phaffii]CAH2449702.1 Kynureninase [Komagataella phaffii CBS 7435]AOA69138.1 GQ68_03531T0 [Komagataella phaffii GS115]CAY70537.1 hypothetical protein PAS_chr3_1194 [Komagataella phaffii GS115]CCA39675.1 Kynureninase [Komagataella phaffii CBS 7435]